MTVPNEQFALGMHRHQRELFGAFDHRLYKKKVRVPQYFHTEWHRRARKTTGLLNLQVKEACRVAKTKHVYVAPTQVQARNIVWDDPNMIRAALPDKREISWKMNEQKMMIFFANGSMYKLGGADEPDSWRGIDGISFVLDEWALMKYTLWTEIIRPILAGELHPNLDMLNVFRWVGFSYTPKGINHATQGFDDACMLTEGGILPECGQAVKMRDNCYASRLDGELSGILSQEELEKMRDEIRRGLIPQALYDQEIKCSRVTSEEMTLITTEMLHELNRRLAGVVVEGEVRKIVSVDPAFGGDVCKIMGIENRRVTIEEGLQDKHNTGEVVMAAKLVAQRLGTKNFIVDSIGNGLGVADGLAIDAACYNVQYFQGSESPDKDAPDELLQFANLRAESYYYTSEQIRQLRVAPITSAKLMQGLPIASRYSIAGSKGRLIILPKTKIKELLGRSSDDEDCYTMGIWGSQNVLPEDEADNQLNRSRRPRSAMA